MNLLMVFRYLAPLPTIAVFSQDRCTMALTTMYSDWMSIVFLGLCIICLLNLLHIGILYTESKVG